MRRPGHPTAPHRDRAPRHRAGRQRSRGRRGGSCRAPAQPQEPRLSTGFDRQVEGVAQVDEAGQLVGRRAVQRRPPADRCPAAYRATRQPREAGHQERPARRISKLAGVTTRPMIRRTSCGRRRYAAHLQQLFLAPSDGVGARLPGGARTQSAMDRKRRICAGTSSSVATSLSTTPLSRVWMTIAESPCRRPDRRRGAPRAAPRRRAAHCRAA